MPASERARIPLFLSPSSILNRMDCTHDEGHGRTAALRLQPQNATAVCFIYRSSYGAGRSLISFEPEQGGGGGRGRGLVCLTSWPIASVNFRSCFVLSSSFLPIWQAFLESKRSRQPHHRICIGRVLLRKSVGFCGGGQLFFPDHFIVVVVPLLSHITRSFFLLPFPSPLSSSLSLSSLGLPRVFRTMFRIVR